MAIAYDSGGFIIGERRAKEIADGVNQTQGNTKLILDFLKESTAEMKATAEKQAKTQKTDLERQIRQGRAVNASAKKDASIVRKVVDASESLAKTTDQIQKKNKRFRRFACCAS